MWMDGKPKSRLAGQNRRHLPNPFTFQFDEALQIAGWLDDENGRFKFRKLWISFCFDHDWNAKNPLRNVNDPLPKL